MAKLILAVSGGVDSVVMLDFLAHKYSPGDIIVAHFNHGLRANAAKDEEFVRELAANLGVKFVSEKGELKTASEETARQKRYDFLNKVAREEHGVIYTAHHLDDLVETVAINFVRGTGWRGLAALDNPALKRPFLDNNEFYEPMDKVAILEYAGKRGLKFREDQSNSWDEYLRNRVRERLAEAGWEYEKKLELYELWQRQKAVKAKIDETVTALLPEPGQSWKRAWFHELEPAVALELLRAGTLRVEVSATRPQLEDFRQAIINYAPGKCFNLPGDRLVRLSKLDFEL